MVVGLSAPAMSALSSRAAVGQRVRARVAVPSATSPSSRRPLRVVAEDFPQPAQIKNTDNYRDGEALSKKFKELKGIKVYRVHKDIKVFRVLMAPLDLQVLKVFKVLKVARVLKVMMVLIQP